MPPSLYEFGEFELDRARFELRRNGCPLKLERIPLELLILLAEKDGNVVTRQEIIQRLWGGGVHVDTEHGINTAIRKIRLALRDDSEDPHFIQTVTGKGYRFVGKRLAPPPIAPAGAGLEAGNGKWAGFPRDSAPVPTRSLPSTPEQNPGNSRWQQPAVWASILAAVLCVAAYFGWRQSWVGGAAGPGHVMLAVLPFENLSVNPNDDYFSDGLTEEMITQLGALSPDHLGVIARTTSMAYKHTAKTVQQIGRELGVDYVLESSVRRESDHLRIGAQLIRTRDQVQIWAHNYDRHISGSLTLQEEVAREVADQIEVKLRPADANRQVQSHSDAQANEAYMRGRFFWNQFTGEGYRKAIIYFRQAIDLDPNFAEAYAGLADCYRFLIITDTISPAEGMPKIVDAAHQAVLLGDGLAESHTAMAGAVMDLWDWPGAEREFNRAIALNPSYSNMHRLYAAFLAGQRRHGQAWQQIGEAMRLDPLSLPNNAEVVRTLYYARDYDAALVQGQKAIQLAPDYYRTHFWLARVYAQKRMYQEAIAESEIVAKATPDSNLALTELAYSLAVGGRRDEARDLLKRLEERSKRAFVPAYNLAVIHLALNQKDDALRYLQKSYEEHDWALFVLSVEPRLDPIRGDPRFQELSAKLKLPL